MPRKLPRAVWYYGDYRFPDWPQCPKCGDHHYTFDAVSGWCTECTMGRPVPPADISFNTADIPKGAAPELASEVVQSATPEESPPPSSQELADNGKAVTEHVYGAAPVQPAPPPPHFATTNALAREEDERAIEWLLYSTKEEENE